LLIMLVLFAAIIIGGVWLVVGRPRHTAADRAAPAAADPEQILGERLARGEIDPDEYRVRLAALREHGPRA
jgi:putative membrane protein